MVCVHLPKPERLNGYRRSARKIGKSFLRVFEGVEFVPHLQRGRLAHFKQFVNPAGNTGLFKPGQVGYLLLLS